MTVELHNPADELGRLIEEGRISEDALQAMTNMPPERLRSFLDEAEPGMTRLTTRPPALSNDESARLSSLAAQLTEGMRVGGETLRENRPREVSRSLGRT